MVNRFAKIWVMAAAGGVLGIGPVDHAIAAPAPSAALCGSTTPTALIDYLKKHRVEIVGEKDQIRCDAAGVPNFEVKFPYDPQSSQTDEYFHDLYFNLAKLLRKHDYALIDRDDNVKIHITVRQRSKRSFNMRIKLENYKSI